MGPNILSLQDIDSYCRYSGIVLKWSEILVIKELDELFLTHYKPPSSDVGS